MSSAYDPDRSLNDPTASYDPTSPTEPTRPMPSEPTLPVPSAAGSAIDADPSGGSAPHQIQPPAGAVPPAGAGTSDQMPPSASSQGQTPFGEGPDVQTPYAPVDYGQAPGSTPYGQAPGSTPYGQPAGYPPYGQAPGSTPYGQAPGPTPYGQPAGYPPYGQGGPAYGQAPSGQHQYGSPAYVPTRGTNTMSILALVLALVFAPVGIVLGHLALREIRRTGEDGRGLAIAGLVIGYGVTALLALYFVFMIVVIGSAAHSITQLPSSYPTMTSTAVSGY